MDQDSARAGLSTSASMARRQGSRCGMFRPSRADLASRAAPLLSPQPADSQSDTGENSTSGKSASSAAWMRGYSTRRSSRRGRRRKRRLAGLGDECPAGEPLVAAPTRSSPDDVSTTLHQPHGDLTVAERPSIGGHRPDRCGSYVANPVGWQRGRTSWLNQKSCRSRW
jgi:hypothetical protein